MVGRYRGVDVVGRKSENVLGGIRSHVAAGQYVLGRLQHYSSAKLLHGHGHAARSWSCCTGMVEHCLGVDCLDL